MAEAYFQVLDAIGYTWEELLNEKLCRTLFTMEMLEKKSEEIDDETETPDINNEGPTTLG